MFITFEGIEGSGKTTQAAMAANKIKDELGLEIIITREPGGTSLGNAVRSLLLHSREEIISHKSELLLFMADRAQHCEEIVKKALDKNKAVLCDRFYDATTAYQGYARGIDLDFLKQLNTWATSGLKPDLTILLDLDPEKGLKRIGSRKTGKDRIEKEEMLFHVRVRNGYLAIAEDEPKRIKVIDALGSIDEIHNNIWKEIINIRDKKL